jgi:alkylation response protein AidB-like acyl-CoA dehydrogenase
MNLQFTAEQQLLRRTIRDFAEAEIRPFVAEWDDAQAFPATLVAHLAALGLMGIEVPEDDGGAGLSPIEYCICIEELARVDPSIALSVAAHNGLAVGHLARFGSADQRARFLKPLAEGTLLGGWALTEAGSGSDAAAMRTTARRDGDQWVLSGTKQFITHGRLAGLLVVIAVTDPAKRTHGMSAFVVPRDTPGLRAGRKENKLGMRASDTSEVIFEDCRLPADALIGEEGEGFIQTMRVLDGGRVGIAALAVGLAQGAYEAALAHAQARRQFGRPIAEFQAIRWKLADMATRLEAARWLTYRAAWLRDHPDEGPATSSSIAKLYATETAVRAADECVQIHGGYGFVKDYPAEKYFRDVKLCTIGEGTSEIQRLVIARDVLGRL